MFQHLDAIVTRALLEDLKTALHDRDGDRAVSIIGDVAVVAGPEFTSKLVDGLIAIGLQRLATSHQEDRK